MRAMIRTDCLLLLLAASIVNAGGVSCDRTSPRPTMLQPAYAAPALAPYKSLADVPREAWFRRIGPPHLVDQSTWWRVTSVDPSDGSLSIGGRYWLPNDMLPHWVYTLDPFVENPVIQRCGK